MLALTGYKLANYMASRLADSSDKRLADCHSLDSKSTLGQPYKVDPIELINGQWIFIDQPFPNARNANFIALKSSGVVKANDAFFFKQPLLLSAQLDTLYNEAQFYDTISHKVKELSPHLLKVVQYDYFNKILILEYRRRSLMFSDFMAHLPAPRNQELGKLRLEATHKLAALLNRFKTSLSLTNLGINPPQGSGIDKICLDSIEKRDSCFRMYTPWILTLTDADLLRFNESSVDSIKEFARLLYGKDPDARFSDTVERNTTISGQFVLREEFKKLQQTWITTHLINADAHLSNIIIDDSNTFFFIDWEYASWGDCRWDFAGILAGYFTFMRAENPVLSVPEVKSHVRVLCQEYFQGESTIEREKNLLICIQYTGLWLLTEYYAWAVSDSQSDNSIFQDKFRLGKLCVFTPDTIRKGFSL